MQDKNQNNIEETSYTNPRDVEPVVIGELRKEKIGRPMIVIELAVLFVIVLVGLPMINSMMNDENSVLYKFLNGNSSSNTNVTTKQAFVDAKKEQPLLKTTSMKTGNIILKNFLLYNNTIKMTISSYNDIINLDEDEYYFEILSNQNNNKIAYVKLTGTYDYQEKELEFKTNVNFNSNMTYLGKVVLMTDDDYHEYKLETDESGIGNLTCKKDDRELDYVFSSDKLISFSDTNIVKKAGLTDEDYLSVLGDYKTLASNLGKSATLEETSDGILFKASVDLEKDTVPESVKDYNYYVVNTNVKKIYYSMTGKGFDCK